MAMLLCVRCDLCVSGIIILGFVVSIVLRIPAHSSYLATRSRCVYPHVRGACVAHAYLHAFMLSVSSLALACAFFITQMQVTIAIGTFL